jgi:hypothetical protein
MESLSWCWIQYHSLLEQGNPIHLLHVGLDAFIQVISPWYRHRGSSSRSSLYSLESFAGLGQNLARIGDGKKAKSMPAMWRTL